MVWDVQKIFEKWWWKVSSQPFFYVKWLLVVKYFKCQPELLFYGKKRFKSCLTCFFFPRSPGKIISVSVPTFEALTQFGVARITTKNTGEVEASYGLTVVCFSILWFSYIYFCYPVLLMLGQANVDLVFFINLMTDMHYLNFYTRCTVL